MTRRAGTARVALLAVLLGGPVAWAAPAGAPAAPSPKTAPAGRSEPDRSAAILASLTTSERTALAQLKLEGPGVDSIVVTARADEATRPAAVRSPALSDMGLASLLMVLTAAGASVLLRRLTHV